jgi:hypothetical protein
VGALVLRRARPPVRAAESHALDATVGAIAGIVATVAMTLAAEAMHRRLPRRERYPLPPREITESLLPARAVQRLGEPGIQAATLASHAGFGAAAGALFWPLFRGTRWPVIGGVGYALGVWAASYFGWVPATGRLRPAHTHPPRRNALMLAAHVVWGASLGLTSRALDRATPAIAEGPLKDR